MGIYLAWLYVAVISLDLSAVFWVFQTCTPFAWQLPSIIITWVFIKKFLINWQNSLCFSNNLQKNKYNLLGLTLFIYLSVWISLVSAPMILFLAMIELLVTEARELSKKKFNLRQLRVRLHNDGLARIEFLKENIINITTQKNLNLINAKFKELGFIYIAIDIEVFRSGSMDEHL